MNINIKNLLSELTSDEINYMTSCLDKDKTIVVGMSGGVDSSLTCALLYALGFNIIGATLQLHDKSKKCCSGYQDVLDAKEIAAQIGFSHHTLDYSHDFNQFIMQDFKDTYTTGYTPNPCIRCNKYIKFGNLLSFAIENGAQAIATGHYIKHFISDENVIRFTKSNDPIKDQTYFISMVDKNNIQYMRFPLGCMVKTRVRYLAKIAGLSVATKKDSQDLCFAKDASYRAILEKLSIKMNKGLIIDTENNILGEHEGIHRYTVGQRKGLDLPNGPWFVIEIDAEKNLIIAGSKEQLFKNTFYVDNMNWLFDFDKSKNLYAKVRSRNDEIKCDIEQKDNIYQVNLHESTHSIAPGQTCAFYQDDILVGGARIIK